MRLRNKALTIVGSTVVALILILFISSKTILLGGFSMVENIHMAEDVERVLSAHSDELLELDTINYDWAAWDDTYEFIVDGNEDYIDSNLVDSTYTGIGLNLILFIDSSGRIVYGQGFDLESEEPLPVTESIGEHITVKSPLLDHPDTESRVFGLLMLPEGPMLISSRPIITSDDEGPIKGALIFGRYFDSSELELLAGRTLHSLSVIEYRAAEMPADFKTARSFLSKKNPIFVQTLDEDRIAGYAVLEDIYGRPNLLLRVDVKRDIHSLGKKTLSYFVISLLISGLVFVVITIWLLEATVLKRLTDLSNSVTRIGESGDKAQRVYYDGADEISNLAENINSMLDSLEKAEEDLRNHRDKLEYEVKKQTAELTKRLNELENWQRLTAGREVKMVDLKKELDKIQKRLSKYEPV